MSSKSQSSRSLLDSQVWFSDFEDLDYEPDGIDKPQEDVLTPEPSGQDFRLESSNSPEEQNFSYGPLVYPKSPPGIHSFRDDFNYKHLAVNIDSNSFRSQYNTYTTCEGSYHLDSSEDEDGTLPEFDRSSFNPNEVCYTNGAASVSSHNSSTILMPQSPDVMIPPRPGSCDIKSTTISLKSGSVSSMKNVEEKIDQSSQEPKKVDKPTSKAAALNFTIQVTGQRRCFLNKLRIKTKQKPWLIAMRRFLKDIIQLNSTDEVIKFCPFTEVQIATPSLSSTRSVTKNSDISSNVTSVFKIPLKRPPTRQKEVNAPVLKSGIENVKEIDDNSDIISLIASTNFGEDNHDTEMIFKNDVKSEPSSVAVSLPECTILEDIDPKEKEARVIEWLQTNNSIVTKSKVPFIYKGLCFKYFFDDNCRMVFCDKKHDLQVKMKQIANLPDVLFHVAYDFAKSNHKFFNKIYKQFANIFASKGNKKELSNMIDLIFCNNYYALDRLEGLMTIIQCLEKTDLGTFENAVNFILAEVDYSTYSIFGSTLLEAILSMNNLPQHWPLIRNLFEKGEIMSLKMAQRFITHLMKPPVDSKMCKEVYQYINKYKCLNLPAIHASISEPFLKLCTTKNIEKHIDEVSINTPYSVKQNSQQPIPAANVAEATASDHSENVSPYNSEISLYQRSDFEKPTSLGGCIAKPIHSLNFKAPSVEFSDLNEEIQSSSVSIFSDQHSPLRSAATSCTIQQQSILSNSQQCTAGRKRKSSFSSYSSDGDNANNKLSTKQFVVGCGSTYIQEGLQYDPTNDYKPPPSKTKRKQSSSNHARQTTPTLSLDNIDLDQHVEIIVNENGSKRSQKEISNKNATVTIEPTNMLETTTNGHRTVTRDPNNKYECTHEPTTLQSVKPGYSAEEQVSSSSDMQYRNQKIYRHENGTDSTGEQQLRCLQSEHQLTDHPSFGRLCFNPSYEFNVSLHNLYLQRIDNIDIDEEDVLALNDCVKSGDGEKFINLSFKYQGPATIQNFISMTLAHLKGMNQMVARKYKSLLTSIETHKSNVYSCLNLRVILEVITMNLLFILAARNMFIDAQHFLTKFSNWDSLVTSRLFITNVGSAMSIMGRYLFIAKLLVKCKPELAYEILDCPTFKFFDENHTWPYHPPSPIPEISNSDLQVRNQVLKELLKNGYHMNIVTVIQLYNKALKRKGGIWLFDVKPFIEPMIQSIINNVKPGQLKQIFGVIHMFCNYLQSRTMRALLITMCPYLNKTDCFKLFQICTAKNVYSKLINGDTLEHVLNIKTNMLPCEIELIILYYFYQLKEIRNLPPGSEPLKFRILLPGTDFKCKYLPILNVNRSVRQIAENIINDLKSKCSIQAKLVSSNLVVVEKDDLIKYLENANGCRM